MANTKFLDGDGVPRWGRSVGAGSDADPFISEIIVRSTGGNALNIDTNGRPTVNIAPNQAVNSTIVNGGNALAINSSGQAPVLIQNTILDSRIMSGVGGNVLSIDSNGRPTVNIATGANVSVANLPASINASAPLHVINDRFATIATSITIGAGALIQSYDAVGQFTFSNVVLANGGRGIIEQACLKISRNQATPFIGRLLLFKTLEATVSHGNTFAGTANDLENYVGEIRFESGRMQRINPTAGADGKVCIPGIVTSPVPHFVCGGSSQNLIGVLVDNTDPLSTTANGYTTTTSEVFTIELDIRRI